MSEQKKSQGKTYATLAVLLVVLVALAYYVLVPEQPKPRKRALQTSDVTEQQTQNTKSVSNGAENVSSTSTVSSSLSADGSTLVRTTTITDRAPAPHAMELNQPTLTEDDKKLLVLMRKNLTLQLSNEVKEKELEESELNNKISEFKRNKELQALAAQGIPMPPVFEHGAPASPAVVEEVNEDPEPTEDKEANLSKAKEDVFSQVEVAFVSVTGTNASTFLRYRGKVKKAVLNTYFDGFTVKAITPDYVELHSAKYDEVRKLPTPTYSVSTNDGSSSVTEYSVPQSPISLPPEINGLPTF